MHCPVWSQHSIALKNSRSVPLALEEGILALRHPHIPAGVCFAPWPSLLLSWVQHTNITVLLTKCRFSQTGVRATRDAWA